MSPEPVVEVEAGAPDCTQCGGRGSWVQYLHGTDPKNYPVHECRVCRCRCGRLLDPDSFHDADEFGGQVCEVCCSCVGRGHV